MARVILVNRSGETVLNEVISAKVFVLKNVPIGDYELRVDNAIEKISVTSQRQTIRVVATEGPIASQYRKMNLKSDFGAIGDGVVDDFQALKRAFLHTVNEPIELRVPEGTYLLQGNTNERLEVWPAKSKGISIIGDTGATFKAKHNRTTNVHEHYFFQFVGDGNAKFRMENMILDGSLNPALWHINRNNNHTHKATEIPMTRGVTVSNVKTVVYKNNTFRDIYGGYCTVTSEYDEMHSEGNVYENIGGNNYTESFGMAIYLGGVTGDSVTTIYNDKMTGANNPSDPEQMAWIGIVHENGTVQNNDLSTWSRDGNSVINIVDCEINNFETAFHSESQAGNVYVNVDGGNSSCIDWGIYAGIWGEIKARVNRHDVELLPYEGRGGFIQGLHYTEREYAKNKNGLNDVHWYNSTINYPSKLTQAGNKYDIATALGDHSKLTMHNCTLNNVQDVLVQNASAIFNSCEINLAQGNSKTKDTIKGYMSESTMTVEFNNTNLNPFGSWKNAPISIDPPKVKNTGYVPVPMDKPISAAKLEQNAV